MKPENEVFLYYMLVNWKQPPQESGICNFGSFTAKEYHNEYKGVSSINGLHFTQMHISLLDNQSLNLNIVCDQSVAFEMPQNSPNHMLKLNVLILQHLVELCTKPTLLEVNPIVMDV